MAQGSRIRSRKDSNDLAVQDKKVPTESQFGNLTAPPDLQPPKQTTAWCAAPTGRRTLGDSGFAREIGMSVFGGAADIVPMDAIVSQAGSEFTPQTES